MDNLKDILEETVLTTEVLSRGERRKRAVMMKRLQPKIKRTKKRNERKMASPKKIKEKARKLAVNVIKQKLLKKIANGAELTMGDKERVEKFVQKKKKAIDKLAKKFEKKARNNEKERLEKIRGQLPDSDE